MGASVPDAAKPQHFRLEVEARFRDSSRFTHGSVWRSAKNASQDPARLICWAVTDLMETLPAIYRGRAQQT